MADVFFLTANRTAPWKAQKMSFDKKRSMIQRDRQEPLSVYGGDHGLGDVQGI